MIVKVDQRKFSPDGISYIYWKYYLKNLIKLSNLVEFLVKKNLITLTDN